MDLRKGVLKQVKRKEDGISYTLAESQGGERHDEEDRGTHGFLFFFCWNRCLVRDERMCVDLI